VGLTAEGAGTVLRFEHRGLPASHVAAHAEGWRGIDLVRPVWHVLDLLPGGRDDWMPSN
jgi:predicted dithiol-disulfide oxidoreductase (DUF899 family)